MRRTAASGTARCVLLAWIACLALLSGCVPQGLAFRVDDRLTITAPKARSEVSLPVTVRWTVRDFDVVQPGGSTGGRDGGYFAVFVDRAPQPPGRPLSWLARKDRTCRASDGCPDADYLAARNVYTTTDTQLRFEQLPRPRIGSHGKERHTVTVVLLDPAGRRIGESAFQVDFTVRRGSS